MSGAAGPQLMRTMNERLVLEAVRARQPASRTELAGTTGLSKPTVAVAIASLERAGLVRPAGLRGGMRGPAPALYEVRPEAAFVLGLDAGREHVRGAIVDLAGSVRARATHRARLRGVHNGVDALTSLADELATAAGIRLGKVTQVVVGSPGVYDPVRRAMSAAGSLHGWERPDVAEELHAAFGPSTVLENDVALAALAERDLGHGRGVGTFCFVSIGTGIGMGLVIDGRLYRGCHGAAGEIAYLPVGTTGPAGATGAMRGPGPAGAARGRARQESYERLEGAAAAPAVVQSARRRGLGGVASAPRVFAAAAAGDERAVGAVAEEVDLVARAVASVVAVVDPELVVLGGGIGRVSGFADAVADALGPMVPFRPEIVVSALADTAVVDGCVAMGTEMAWRQIVERA